MPLFSGLYFAAPTPQLHSTLLLDGAVSCLCFYDLNASQRSRQLTNAASSHIIVGLASGIGAVLKLDRQGQADDEDDMPIVLPGAEEHGSLNCITIGDINVNGLDEIVS